MAMAGVYKKLGISKFFLYFTIILCTYSTVVNGLNRELNENDWRDILKGEWMVEFYAPWCPACNALQTAWKELSMKAAKKSIHTGAVDVTVSPGLSGRFVVTALPTIYHVKNGEFRQYKGPRDVDSMLNYVLQEKWKQTEPVPSWKAPDSIQMSLVAEFFKLSQALRGVHNMLMETYGLPTWGSYLIFAIATIFIGAMLGLLLVCVIDMLYPPKRAAEKVLFSKKEVDRRATGDQDGKDRSDDDNELVNEDIVDEDEQQNSDAERNSPSDSSEEDKPKQGGDKSAPELRKRRPRKAD